MALLAYVIAGLLVGVIAKATFGRRQGLIGLIGLGILGAIIGGVFAPAFLGTRTGELQSAVFLFAIAGAAIAILTVRLVRRSPKPAPMQTNRGWPADSAPSTLLTFISYRREEASGHAGRLYDLPLTQFRSDQVFMDVDAIPPGVDFGVHIQAAVARCDVLLAMIGPRWSTLTDDRGMRRIDNPRDVVRIEIESALRRDIRVVPLLVQGSQMPREEDLPEPLRPLARRNALELSDTHFRFDADRLIDYLIKLDAAKPPMQV